MKLGNSDILDLYVGSESVRAYLGSQLIIPTVIITGTWNPSLTDKNKKVIISGEVTLTGKTDCYSITFASGGHLTINGGARLRVWQGGIVNNNCATVNYLTIVEDAVNNVYGEFLLHPAVTVNNHPLASVELISKSYYEGGKEVDQRLCMPTYNGNITLSPVNPGSVGTMIKTWDYTTDDWGAWSNISSGVTYTDAELFRGYLLASNNVKNAPMTYELTSVLMGNDNANVKFRQGYNNYANSYVALIKTTQLLSLLSTHNITSIHVMDNNDDWLEINLQNVSQWPYIQPIYRAFLIQNAGAQYNLTLSYKDLVWNPSFEEEVIPTHSLMKGALTSNKPTEIDTALEGSAIFDNPKPIFPPENDER